MDRDRGRSRATLNGRVVAICAIFLLSTASAGAAQLRGRVLDVRTGNGISGAIVRIIGSGIEREAVTDESGGYLVAALSPAEYALRVQHPGYDPASMHVRMGADATLLLDVRLLPRAIPLPPLLIPIARETRTARSTPARPDDLLQRLEEERAASLRVRAASPLADLVPAAVADRSPGSGGEHPHALHIWGSSSDRGRVLVDGASINAPLHLGGILPPIEPELLSGTTLRTGGAPARFDGGTSYIMDFRTRSPIGRSPGGWGEVGMLATRLGMEVPFDGHGSVMVGARRVNSEVVDGLIDGPFGYSYGDLLVRGELAAGPAGAADAVVLATRERIRIPRDLGFDDAAWRNLASAVSWRPDPAGPARVRLSFSRGIADLPLLSAPDGHLQAMFDRSGVVAENQWTTGGVGVDAGLEVEHVRLSQHSEASADPGLPSLAVGVACTPSLPCSSTRATTFAAFGDVRAPLGRGIGVRAGLRTAFETRESRFLPLPRLAVTWTDRDGASAAALSLGRFSQVAVAELAPNTVTADRPGLTVATDVATQLELRLTRSTPTLALTAAGWLRRDEGGLRDPDGRTTPGAELSWVLQVGESSLSGGYSFLARRAAATDSAGPQHLAWVGAGATRGKLKLELSGEYGVGVPLTSIVLDGIANPQGFSTDGTPAVNDSRPYLRVDGGLSGTWSLRMNDRFVHFTPYLRVVNAFGRRGALFYYQDGGQNGLQPLSALPTMPVAGVRWTF